MEEDEKNEGFRNRLIRSSRAKNQTVMLTPEIAGQVRAMVRGEEKQETPEAIAERNSILRGQTRKPNSRDLFTPHHGRGSKDSVRGEHRDPPEEESRDLELDHRFGDFDSRASADLSLEGGYESDSMSDDFSAKPYDGNSKYPPAREPSKIVSNKEDDFIGGNMPFQSPSAVLHEARENQSIRVVMQGELTKLIGFLVSFDIEPNGEACELRLGRWIVSSKTAHDGNSIVIADPSVSRLHAIIRVTNDGKVQILDQLSEYGTTLIRAGSDEEQEVVGAMVTVGHGDRVRFGKRTVSICLLSYNQWVERGEE